MEIARHWRLNNQRYQMQGSVCTCCGKTFFAPRPVCDVCSQNDSAILSFNANTLRRESADVVYAAGK